MTTTTTMPEAKITYTTTPRDLHVLMPWLNVVRCLRSAARNPDNYGSHIVIKIVVVANCEGRPLSWTKPKVTMVEGDQTLDVLLNALSDG